MPKKATISNSKSCNHSKKVFSDHSNKAKKPRKKDHRINNYIDTIQL